tara:strand:+ start:206 stop:484 length:279 start_codon:yes stop_codon:yes gene_type:complete
VSAAAASNSRHRDKKRDEKKRDEKEGGEQGRGEQGRGEQVRGVIERSSWLKKERLHDKTVPQRDAGSRLAMHVTAGSEADGSGRESLTQTGP